MLRESHGRATSGCFGYLMNDLPGTPTSLLPHADVTFGEHKARPVVWLHDAEHPLVEAQREGVTLERVASWVAAVIRHTTDRI